MASKKKDDFEGEKRRPFGFSAKNHPHFLWSSRGLRIFFVDDSLDFFLVQEMSLDIFFGVTRHLFTSQSHER